MKKSEIYFKAQMAVLRASDISDDERLTVLKELMDREDTCRLLEEREEKNNENN